MKQPAKIDCMQVLNYRISNNKKLILYVDYHSQNITA